MQYIQPIGQIGLVSDYRGDIGYNHTVLFENEAEQKNWFNEHSLLLTNYQYNKDRVSFTVGMPIDSVSKYGYMWFTNSPDRNNVFETKRYYSFITDIKYINNTATEITFTIDYMQTFMFNIYSGQCMVEREHTLSDKLFEHIVPENINVDETVTTNEINEYFDKRMLCAIVTKDRMVSVHKEIDGTRYVRVFSETFAPINISSLSPYSDNNVGGSPNTLYWYTGIPVSEEDVDLYRSTYGDTYDMQPMYYNNGEKYATSPSVSPRWEFTASGLLELIKSNKVEGANGTVTTEDVVAVYLYPSQASVKLYIESGLETYHSGISVKTRSVNNISDFVDITTNEIYHPKNKKLFTYPYTYIECLNNEGTKNVLKFENFSVLENEGVRIPRVAFKILMSRILPVVTTLVPVYYSGDSFDYENSISVSSSPPVFYDGTILQNYLAQNSNKREASLQASAISATVGGLASIISKNPLPIVSGVTNYIANANSLHAELMDLKSAPNENYSVFNTDYLNNSLKQYGITIKQKSIKLDIAKQIDDYFTMYGYRINKLKVPNVLNFLNGLEGKLRPHFNYIKTNGIVIIEYNNGGMLTSEVKNAIAKIFDKGITFWCANSYVGDYNRENNAPIQ